MATKLDTTNWVSYPFSVKGMKFKTLLDPKGSFYERIEMMPKGQFMKENVRIFLKSIGDPNLLSAKQLQKQLDEINEGASQALLAIA
ncbi:hypothetical protein FJZ33_06415 [Candidatus Poribacteria bacterium]|nr:hypothetical protein [Candidatus Poribacteria bacterium]